MRRWTRYAILPVLVLCLDAGAAKAQGFAADRGGDPATTEKQSNEKQPGLFRRMLSFGRNGPNQTRKDKVKASALKAQAKFEEEQKRKIAADNRRKRALADLLRRNLVCDRLEEIALRTGDQKLEQIAAQLRIRAEAVYNKHTGGGLPDRGKWQQQRGSAATDSAAQRSSSRSADPNRRFAGRD